MSGAPASSSSSGCWSAHPSAIRAFVALLLDAGVRASLAAAIDRLRRVAPAVAWVAPDNLHVTLKFLGQVDPARVDTLAAALARAAAGVEAFDLAVGGLGAFPTPIRPRVVWAGLTAGTEAATALAAGVEAALGVLGFAPEDRPFTPHITLGRVRVPRRDPALARALAEGPAAFGRVRVERVSLMRSDLRPDGARYTELSALPLGAAAR